jgi:hypothetical protein
MGRGNRPLTYSEKKAISDAVNEIYAIIRALPSPRDAAKALAGAHVRLMEADGATTDTVREKMRDVHNAVLESWSARAGEPVPQ